MNKFEELRNRINEYIQQHKFNEDNCVLQSIFSLSNLNEVNETERNGHSVFEQTQYTNLNRNELVKMFNRENFNNLPKDKMTELFQEVYNRHSDKNDAEKRYVTTIEPYDSVMVMAYVETDKNKLVLNENVINSSLKGVNPFIPTLNPNTVGLNYLMVCLHEIEHSIQFSEALKFVVDENKDEDKKALGAMMLMSYANEVYARKNKRLDLILKYKMLYGSDWLEHNANNYAITEMIKDYKLGNITTKKTANIITDFMCNSVILTSTMSHVMKKKIFQKMRIHSMEKNIKSCLKDFKKHCVVEGELSEKIYNTISDYIKVDVKGKSKFKEKASNDLLGYVDALEMFDRFYSEQEQFGNTNN